MLPIILIHVVCTGSNCRVWSKRDTFKQHNQTIELIATVNKSLETAGMTQREPKKVQHPTCGVVCLSVGGSRLISYKT